MDGAGTTQPTSGKRDSSLQLCHRKRAERTALYVYVSSPVGNYYAGQSAPRARQEAARCRKSAASASPICIAAYAQCRSWRCTRPERQVTHGFGRHVESGRCEKLSLISNRTYARRRGIRITIPRRSNEHRHGPSGCLLEEEDGAISVSGLPGLTGRSAQGTVGASPDADTCQSGR